MVTHQEFERYFGTVKCRTQPIAEGLPPVLRG